MSASSRTRHKYESVRLNIHNSPQSEGGYEFIADNGFLLLRVIRPGVYIVQSIGTWQIYYVKVMRRCQHSKPRVDVREHEFLHPVPPDVRVSTIPQALMKNVEDTPRSLHTKAYLSNLVYFQEGLDDKWTLYFQYYNGGTLESLIEQYYELNRAIPETFIWNVALHLGKALAYLHTGRTEEEPYGVKGWARIYHRAVAPSNILLHYSAHAPGKIPRMGIEQNAFPQIILSDFSHSAIEGDDTALLKPGLHPNESEPTVWEDIYHYGSVLRLMCMTHIPLGIGLPPFAHKNERGEEAWSQRPDSRLIEEAALYPIWGHDEYPGYSSDLLNALKRFEWINQEKEEIEVQDNKENLFPNMDWIMGSLIPLAEQKVTEYRTGPKPDRFYTDRDVSWTRSDVLPPPITLEDRDEDTLKSLQDQLQLDKGLMKFCEIQFPAPRYRPLPDE
ncbi:hypothetical protein F5Y11DRAFT_327848 [Daldinia sp. FL1419]|nr:hypothetical protein F5Y11DRAFT_327848 [Daldinia sp. FL1419]